MLGGKLFDSKDSGPYTTKNLDGLRSGELKLTTNKSGKPEFVQTETNDTKGDNKKVKLDKGLGGNSRSLSKGAGKVFAYPLGRDLRDSEDSLFIKAIEYVPHKGGAGLGVKLKSFQGPLADPDQAYTDTDLTDPKAIGKSDLIVNNNFSNNSV